MRKLVALVLCCSLLCGCTNTVKPAVKSSDFSSSVNGSGDGQAITTTDAPDSSDSSNRWEKKGKDSGSVKAKVSDTGSSIDLTEMNATLRFAEVQNITNDPSKYVGKKIKMQGIVNATTDEVDGKTYYACVIADTAACCQQGIEFKLSNGSYPSVGDDVTVEGTFSEYKIGDNVYYTLKNAEIV